MGIVYLVRDDRLGRRLALKLLKPGGGATRGLRFQRETVVTARLDHPGIPPVHEVGRTPDGQDYLLMRFVDGESLAEARGRVAARRGEPRELLDALVKVGEAVAYAHSRDTVHRDLKPENVMIGPFGEVQVLDWGLARDLRESAARDASLRARLAESVPAGLTRDGAVLGTLGYMPPEQVEAGGDVDPRADVYALGALLVFVLTGEPPVTGDGPIEVLARTAQGEVELPRARDPGVAPELDAIAARALALRPADRYPRVESLVADLKAYLGGRRVSAYRYRPVEQAVRAVRARPALSTALAVAFVLSVGAALAVGRARVSAASETRAALRERARGAAGEAWEAYAATPAGERERTLGRALSALQTAQRWRALAPDDRPAAEAQFRAALALGEVAQASEEWTLAEEAFGLAAGLGGDDARARAARAGVEDARTAEARRRADAVAGVLDRVRSGELTRRPQGLEDAVFELVRFPEPATVDLLVARLDAVSDELRRVEREVVLSAAEPTAAERAAGARPIEGLAAALDAWGGRGLGEPVPPGVRRPLEAAWARLEDRSLRRGAEARITAMERVSAAEVVAQRQEEALGRGTIHLARVACEALGRLGSGGEGVHAALERYLLAEPSPQRAVHAGLALVRLGDPEAARLLEAARDHFGEESPFWRVVRRARPLEDAAADGTALGYVRRAERLLREGDADGARADVERALELEPELGRAWVARGELRRLAGDAAGALADFDRAIAGDDGLAAAWAGRARALLSLGRFAEAGPAAERAVALGPDDPEAWTARAQARARTNRPDGAIADATRALELDPGHAVALGVRGLARAPSSPAAAARDLERALELAPDDPELWTTQAQVRATTGDVRGAESDLARAIELAPQRIEAWCLRATLRLAQGDVRGARDDVRTALDLDRGSSLAWRTAGQVATSVGDARGAVEAYSEAVRVAPDDANAWLGRGRVLVTLDRPDAALPDLQRAVELDPRRPDGWHWRGQALLALGRAEEALADLTRAVELEPEADLFWVERAKAHAALGDLEAALSDCDEAVGLGGDSVSSFFYRSRYRREAGDVEGAIADLGRAIEIAPTYYQPWAVRAGLRAERGDLAGALDDLDRAIELEPRRDPELYLRRAELREQAGRPEAARRDYATFLERAPNAPSAAEVRERLGR